MTIWDVALMAMHNLWSRKLRTLLNILGVVLACVVLAMMLAGTRGVSDGFDRMINDSEDVRRFAIYRSWEREGDVPEEVLRIDAEMSSARRARLQKRLKKKWLNENSDRVPLDEQGMEELRSLPHMLEVLPESRLRCSISIDETKENASIRIASHGKRAMGRLLFGEYVKRDDEEGMLIGEYAAYRLGFVSDEEVRSLVGRPVTVSVRLSADRGSQLKSLMESDLATLAGSGNSPAAMRRLVKAFQSSALNDKDKALFQSVFGGGDTKSSSDGMFQREYVVRGVVRDAEEGEGFSLFDFVGSNSGADVYMPSLSAGKIETQKEGFESFYGAVGVVDRAENLEQLLADVDELGFSTRSSWRIVKRIDEEIGKARMVIGALSFLILVISAIGISNTMVVSVLERTREFGILKAVGSEDRSILQLMLLEGALTGLVGSFVAIVMSFTLAQVIAVFVKKYIAGRIGEQFDASVFSFSALDLLIVILLAVSVCTVAAILPAWRAARLDPVVAMRGR